MLVVGDNSITVLNIFSQTPVARLFCLVYASASSAAARFAINARESSGFVLCPLQLLVAYDTKTQTGDKSCSAGRDEHEFSLLECFQPGELEVALKLLRQIPSL